MELNYNNWRLSDPCFNCEEAWPAEQFPDADYRYFCDAGCLIFALAGMLVHYGLEKGEDGPFDPRILNRRLIDGLISRQRHVAFRRLAQLVQSRLQLRQLLVGHIRRTGGEGHLGEYVRRQHLLDVTRAVPDSPAAAAGR